MRKSLAFAAFLALSACGTSPEPAYYELSAVPGAPQPGFAENLRVERPAVAAYLDQPQIVRQKGNRIDIDEMNRWSEPLDRMTERLLAEDLRERLPDSLITTADDRTTAKACRSVETSIQTFNRVDGNYQLNAQMVLHADCGCGPARAASVVFSRTGVGTQGTRVMSALLAAYADRVAFSLQQEARAFPACRQPAAAPGK